MHHSDIPSPGETPPALTFDPDAYAAYVADFDLSEVQKRELLEAVWQIMRSFVDRAFGDDAAQLALKDGDESLNSREHEVSGVIRSDHCPNPGEPDARRAFDAHAPHRLRRRD